LLEEIGFAGQADLPARSFAFNPGEIDPKWTNVDDVELVLLQFWTETRPRIEAIDPVAHTVRFTGDVFRSPTWSNIRRMITGSNQNHRLSSWAFVPSTCAE
jgi:hypothetical protein